LDFLYDSIVYNLGFGDWNEETNQLDNQITSKNGDTEKHQTSCERTTII
jgi:hypothetical protein